MMAMEADSGRWSPSSHHPEAGGFSSEDETFSVTEDAEYVLATLQQSHETAELRASFVRLQTMFSDADARRCLEENQAHHSVINVMKHLSSFTDMQQLGLQVLGQFCYSEVLCDGLIQAQAYRFVMKVIMDHINDVEIQKAGMKILAVLVSRDQVCRELAEAGGLEELLQLFSVTVTAFRTVDDIQIFSLDGIAHLLKRNLDLQERFMTIYLVLMLECCQENMKKPDVLQMYFELFEVLAQDDSQRRILVTEHVHHLAMQCVRAEEESEGLLEGSLSLLAVLCKEEAVVQDTIDSGFIVESLFLTMMAKEFNPGIQNGGLQILTIAAPKLFQCEEMQESQWHIQWLKVIYLAMSKHLAEPDVQESGCDALSMLLECRPEVCMWIGESTELKQDPLHTSCLGAVLQHRGNAAVLRAACQCIFSLTADNDGLCKMLMEKNTHLAILEAMRHHTDNMEVMVAVCRALRGLCIFHHDYKVHILEEESHPTSVLHTLVQVLNKYPLNALLQTEAISTVACLLDIDHARHQCFVENFHLLVLSAMSRFPEDEYLLEASVEAMAVMAGAASGAEILNSRGAMDKIVTVLQQYFYNINIVKKGLMALQVLVESEHARGQEGCRDLLQIITGLMDEYSANVSVLKEAVVAMQILADKWPEMSEVMVAEGIHTKLFQLMENFRHEEALHDLASECLYLICCEKDLKSRMLLAACAQGYLQGVECLLEMGADVNMAVGTHTPLYNAVSKQNSSMVHLLLQKQAVTDIQTSLNLSVSNKTHFITGMLLAHIGQDKDGGSVMWSGHNLGDLQPQWFGPTLGCVSLPPSSTGSGKRLLGKLKASAQRRMHRCPSDSEIQSLRHRCFRFPSQVSNLPGTIPESGSDAVFAQSLTSSLTGSGSRSPRRKQLLYVPEDSKRLSLTTIPASPPKGDYLQESPAVQAHETPEDAGTPPFMFEHSFDEWEDWRQATVTGANVPFNPSDPRRKHGQAKLLADMQKRKWARKFSSPRATPRSFSPVISPCPTPTPGMHHSFSFSGTSSSDLSLMESFVTAAALPETDTEESGEALWLDVEPSLEYQMISLDVSNNNIASLLDMETAPRELMTRFQWLQKLDLCANKLAVLPPTFFMYLPSLQLVELKDNEFQNFPEELLQCPRISHIDLSNNQIRTVELKTKAPGLRELNLSGNQLSSFPTGLDACFPGLERLFLARNSLQGLPTDAIKLPSLRFLSFSHNNFIQAIPDHFLWECLKLDTLEAANNRLMKLPSEECAKRLERLSTLKLAQNQLVEREPFYIPKFILELPSLRILDLSGNGLLGFPCPSLLKTQNLKELLLGQNSIAKISLDGYRVWSKLEKLNLSRNKLSELPKDIGYLSSLQSLDISHNKQLSTLPDELGRCSKMWELPLEGLNLDLHDSLVKGRIKDLILYLHNRLKKARHYYRMKLMVVGYGGRGKTTLLHGLKKRYKHPSEDRPTVGVIVDEWKYERPDHNRKMVTYTMSTWDFAGQEEFYSTHQCFLSNRALYLVVFDASGGPGEVDQLKPWLSNIQARAPGCPVIVVGTHGDRLPPEEKAEIISEMEERVRSLLKRPGFPQVEYLCVVDCTKETADMEKLREKVKDTIDHFKVRGQPVMGQKVPASYVKLSELLSEEAKTLDKSFPVLRHTQLVNIIRIAGLDLEDEELQQAVHFLHESGTVLHYEETALQMRDFYFINPGWLCRMMAQIVTVRQINPFITPDGILKKGNVHFLFTGKPPSGDHTSVFPTSLIPQYLRLLEKFEIALPQNEEELLIPCRLPTARPDLPSVEAGSISRVYVMPFTPLGFWARLITRLIIFSRSPMAANMLQLQGQPKLLYWREGIFASWNQSTSFLVESKAGDHDELHINVPASTLGYRLLGYVVDHVDALVDEWYPGLTTVDPMLGHELLERLVPCVDCQEEKIHMFQYEEIVKQSESSEVIKCPVHDGEVSLAQLAPDIMLTDLETEFHLELSQFKFSESPENQLGDGAFGSVYKGTYRDQSVAVKVFSTIADINPHKMLRQEATILRRLKHPSVVSLLAVGMRPRRVMVLEFAAHLSLRSLLKKNKHLSRPLQHRIALQVAEGLMYLHQQLVIYRDLKPDNILIFSLTKESVMNAKISDYGISRFATPYGLVAQEGTPAYRAPEVIRGETYSFQADVFSLGITLYVLVTGGRHPFGEYEFKSEMDKAFADNQAVPPITKRGVDPWPDMQDIISHCLQQVPDYRPSSEDVFKRLSSPELLALKEVIPVAKTTTVECVACQMLQDGHVKVWVASGDCEQNQLSWKMLESNEELQGHAFSKGRILCILPLNDDMIVLGTQKGQIWVYNAKTSELMHAMSQLTDSVLNLQLVPSQDGNKDDIVLAGVANGEIVLYPVSELIQEPHLKAMGLKLGSQYEPVSCLIQHDNKLLVSCGSKVAVMNSRYLAVENCFDTGTKDAPSTQKCIRTMAMGQNLYIAHRLSPRLQVWDLHKGKLRTHFNVQTEFTLEKTDARITAMYLQDSRLLWVGMGGGQLVIVDALSLTPVTLAHRHVASIRSLLYTKLSGTSSKQGVILSGGLGFMMRHAHDVDREAQYGCVAVWDAEFAQHVKTMKEDAKKREELHKRMAPSLRSGNLSSR